MEVAEVWVVDGYDTRIPKTFARSHSLPSKLTSRPLATFITRKEA